MTALSAQDVLTAAAFVFGIAGFALHFMPKTKARIDEAVELQPYAVEDPPSPFEARPSDDRPQQHGKVFSRWGRR